MSTAGNPSIRILHLEDNPLDVALVRRRLALGGLACEILVATGKAEFEFALEGRQFDVILCDYSLPGYSGAGPQPR